MLRADMVQAYVIDLLERLTGGTVTPDADGDLPVHYQGGAFFVRVVGNDGNPLVQVFAVAVAGLAPSPGLYEALNGINTQLQFARAFHVQEQVLIESEMFGADVNPANFEHACRYVAGATDAFGKRLVESFGGRPFFEERKTEAYDEHYPRGLGGYL